MNEARETRVLVTGASGLIGTVVSEMLRARDIEPVGIDLRSERADRRLDIRDLARIEDLLRGVSGVIHLAAVSRVIDGERNPALCWAINVEATRSLLRLMVHSVHKPWFVYASSREVYGQQDVQPVIEDVELRPMNVYARSKVAAEALVLEARDAGLRTAILRFANVYGSIHDHADRVVPAFVAAAVRGATLRVDGNDCSFDVNHVEDVARGIIKVVDRLADGDRNLPPIHFVSGRGITLLELAQLACRIAGSNARIVEASPRHFDVQRFVGDPRRARDLLDWRSTVDLESGLSRLASEFSRGGP